MSETAAAAPLSALWRAITPCSPAATPTPPSVGEIAAAADAAGETRGRAAAQAELAPARAALVAATHALEAAVTIDADTLQPLFAELVTRIAGAVIDAELRMSPAVIERLVTAALAAIEVDTPATLHLSAYDAAHLATPLTVVVDAALEPGEIRVETAHHVVAASLTSRLAEIVAGTA